MVVVVVGCYAAMAWDLCRYIRCYCGCPFHMQVILSIYNTKRVLERREHNWW